MFKVHTQFGFDSIVTINGETAITSFEKNDQDVHGSWSYFTEVTKEATSKVSIRYPNVTINQSQVRHERNLC